MAKPANRVEAKRKKVLSPEEKKYRGAVGLYEATDCIDRFESEYTCLKNAADSLETIIDYKESAKYRQLCLEAADEAVRKGTEKVFNNALKIQENAKTKSDFVAAIEDYERVCKFEYKVEECEKHIGECKKAISHIETVAAYKRRFTVLAVLVVLGIIFWRSPAFPLTKGLIHQSRGEYRAAIQCYDESNGFLIAGSYAKKCYYYIAEKQYEEGKYQGALSNYKNAEDKKDAEAKAAELEKKFISEAGVGDTVRFGKSKWTVLDRGADKVLIFKNTVGAQKPFDTEGGNVWLNSSLRKWINKKKNTGFSDEEREMMIEQYLTEPAKKGETVEKQFLLSVLEYEKYRELICDVGESYWLSDGSKATNLVKCVDKAGDVVDMNSDNEEIYVRQAMWIDISEKQVEEK